MNIESIHSNKIKLKIIKIRVGNQKSCNEFNKKIKTTNGNIKGMQILSWNKTDRPIEDKINEIKLILDIEKPHVMFVNELNLLLNKPRGLLIILITLLFMIIS